MDRYYGFLLRDTALKHYRTKGSRNGYSKYSWYTPIGEKAKGPLYWKQYGRIGTVSPVTGKPIGQTANKAAPRVAAQTPMQAPKVNTANMQKTNQVRQQFQSGNNRIGMQADTSSQRSHGYDHQEELKKERKKNNINEGINTALNFIVGLLAVSPAHVAYAVQRSAKAVGSFISTLKYGAERKLNKSVDEETGFKLKQKEMTPEEDLARVNPSVNDFNSNSKSNCMLCTTSYILRRKGYDVTANKASVGYQTGDLLDWFPDAQIKRYSHPDKVTANTKINEQDKLDRAYNSVINAQQGQNNDFAKDMVKQIEKEYPEGSYGNIMVNWGSGGGHSMFFEIKNGKMIIRDAQINKTYEDPTEILKYTVDCYTARLDNVDFDKSKIKEACKS